MVDIQRVNEYNRKLKDAKEQQRKIQSELEYSKRELSRLCDELSSELGLQVTVDNIEQVYEEQMGKIERNLSIGEEILARINRGTSEETADNMVVANSVNQNHAGVTGSTEDVQGYGLNRESQPFSTEISQPTNNEDTGDGFETITSDIETEVSSVQGNSGSLFDGLYI